jgi:hypothetical protein
MANAVITVLEADGITETDVTVLDVGRQAAAASKSVALATEDKAVLDAMAASLAIIDNLEVSLASDSPGVTALGQATMAASLPVTVASNQTGFPVNPAPAASGGLSIFRSLDLDETEEEVKATAGCIYKIRISNFATSARYVKLYNLTTANTTVGSSTVIDTIPIPPAAAAGNPTVLTESFGGMGLTFDTAISIAATTALADADTGAPSANDVVVTVFYK